MLPFCFEISTKKRRSFQNLPNRNFFYLQLLSRFGVFFSFNKKSTETKSINDLCVCGCVCVQICGLLPSGWLRTEWLKCVIRLSLVVGVVTEFDYDCNDPLNARSDDNEISNNTDIKLECFSGTMNMRRTEYTECFYNRKWNKKKNTHNKITTRPIQQKYTKKKR